MKSTKEEWIVALILMSPKQSCLPMFEWRYHPIMLENRWWKPATSPIDERLISNGIIISTCFERILMSMRSVSSIIPIMNPSKGYHHPNHSNWYSNHHRICVIEISIEYRNGGSLMIMKTWTWCNAFESTGNGFEPLIRIDIDPWLEGQLTNLNGFSEQLIIDHPNEWTPPRKWASTASIRDHRTGIGINHIIKTARPDYTKTWFHALD